MVFWGREASEPIPYGQFQKMWRERAAKMLKPYLRSPEAVRKSLGPLLPHALGMTSGSLEEFIGKKARHIRVNKENGALVIEPVIASQDPEAGKIQFFDASNRTPFSERVHEILAAVEKTGGEVSLKGVGEAGPACLAAAAVSGKVKSVDADMAGFRPDRDGDWEKLMVTPCIRQIGGLELIFFMIGKRPVTLTGTTPAVASMKKRFCR